MRLSKSKRLAGSGFLSNLRRTERGAIEPANALRSRAGFLALFSVLLAAAPEPAHAARAGKGKAPESSPIDRMIQEAQARTLAASNAPAAGSVYSPASALSDPYRDLRASRVDDIVTIIVADRASALSRGATAAQRKSAAKGGIGSIAARRVGALGDLASLSGSSELQSQGSTGRESTLNTTITARVTHVLPNGTLVVEGDKEVAVNSERQVVHVRGVVRVFDLATNNSVRSDRVANLEIRVNGKGVVGDAIRRPNILYRILTGVLPF